MPIRNLFVAERFSQLRRELVALCLGNGGNGRVSDPTFEFNQKWRSQTAACLPQSMAPPQGEPFS
jgi:hypothetical protein